MSESVSDEPRYRAAIAAKNDGLRFTQYLRSKLYRKKYVHTQKEGL